MDRIYGAMSSIMVEKGPSKEDIWAPTVGSAMGLKAEDDDSRKVSR